MAHSDIALFKGLSKCIYQLLREKNESLSMFSA